MTKLERKLKDILNKNRTVTSVADELQVSRQTIYKWLKAYEEKGSKAFAYRKIKSGIFAEENVTPKNISVSEPILADPFITETPKILDKNTSINSLDIKNSEQIFSPEFKQFSINFFNGFSKIISRTTTVTSISFITLVLIVSSFFIGKNDVIHYATLAESVSAESSKNIANKSILTNISVKIYCGVNYLLTSSDTWKCKTVAPAQVIVIATTTPVISAVTVTTTTATTSPVTVKEVAKYTPQVAPKTVTAKQTTSTSQPKIINNYITKYVPVPGPKGDAGERGVPGAMGPSGSYSYVPVLTYNTNGSVGASSNQNLISPTLTNAFLNGTSTFNGIVTADDISTNLLTVSGSSTLATTTLTSLFANTTQSLLSSSTDLLATRSIFTNSTTTTGYFSNLFGAGLSPCNNPGDKLLWANGTFYCGTDAGAGGGLTNLNGSTLSGQSFTVTSTGGLSLSITTATTTGVHTFAIDLASGYFVPRTASTTDWNNFFNTPTNYLTAGSNILLSGTSTIAVNPNSIFTSVGIGTTTPSSLLTIQSTSTSNPFSITSSSGASLFTILANGNVGIGKLNPENKLEVVGQAIFGGISPGSENGNNIQLNSTSWSTHGITFADHVNPIYWNQIVSKGIDSGDFGLKFQVGKHLSAAGFGGSIAFEIAGSEKMRITNDGKLLLGTTTSSSLLSLASSTANGTASLFSISTSTSLFNVLANGNIGIGTTTPESALTLASGQMSLPLGTVGAPSITPAGDTTSGIFWYTPTNLSVAVGGTERFRVGSGGAIASTGGYAVGLSVAQADTWLNRISAGVFGIGSRGLGYDSASDKNGTLVAGQVSLGTTTPFAQLSIQGNHGSTTPLFSIASTTSSSYATSSLFTVLANGNIGVGLINPTNLFDVNGVLGVKQPGGVSGINELTISHNGHQALFVNSASASSTTKENFVFTGPRTGGGTVRMGFDSAGQIFSDYGSIRFNTSAGQVAAVVNGGWSTKDSYQFMWSSDPNPAGNPDTGLARFATSTVKVTNGSTGWGNLIAGNIGIGTTTPSMLLSIASSTGASIFGVTNDGILSLSNPLFGHLFSMNDNGSGVLVTKKNGTEISGIDSTGLRVPNGLSIGWTQNTAATIAMDTAFSRISANKIGVGNGMQGDVSGTLIAGNIGIGTTTSSAILTIVGTSSKDLLTIASSSGASLFTVLANGNVGVGTIIPTSKLTIAAPGTGNVAFNIPAENGNTGFMIERPFANNSRLTWYGSGTGIVGSIVDSLGMSADGAWSFSPLAISQVPLSIIGTSGQTANIFNVTASGGSTGGLLNVQSNGNIGIGTTNPTQKLSVSGNASFTGGVGIGTTSPFAALNIYAEENDGIRLDDKTNNRESYITNTSFGLGINAAGSGLQLLTGGATSMTVDSLGNIGIGTTTPSGKLTVTGSSYGQTLLDISTTYGGTKGINIASNGIGVITTGITVRANNRGIDSTASDNTGTGVYGGGYGNLATGVKGSSGGGGVGVYGESDSNGGYAIKGNGLTGADIMLLQSENISKFIIKNNGNVGIGTTTPSSLLTIQGTSSQDLLSISSSTGSSLFTILANGNIGIGTTTPLSTLSVAGGLQDPFDVYTTSSSSVFHVANSGLVSIGSSADITNRGEMLRLNIGSSGNSPGFLTFKRASEDYASYQIGFNGGEGFGLKQIGDSVSFLNVSSLGTLNSNKQISFGSGNGQVSDSVTIYNSLVGGTPTHLALSNLQTSAQSNTKLAFQSWYSPDTLAYETASIVGIKYNSSSFLPQYGLAFNIANNSTSTSEAMRISSNGNIGIGTTTPSSMLSIASSTATGTANLFSVATSSSIFNVLANGNIGIGTTNPGAKLEVVGSMYVTGGGDIYTTGGNIQVAGGYSFRNLNDDLRLTTQTAKDIILLTSASSEKMRIKDSGNIGIGTTTPGSLLTVSSSTANGDSSIFSIATNLSIFNVLANGNLGIGTSTPSTKLDVWGNLTIGTGTVPTFYVNTATNKVGIGTKNPTGNFDIYANVNSDLFSTFQNAYSGKASYFFNQANSVYAANGFNTPGGSWLIGNYGSDNFIVRDHTNSKNVITVERLAPVNSLYINSTGKIGLGTSTPSEKLQVEGNILISNNASLLTNGIGDLILGNNNQGQFLMGGDGANSIMASLYNNLIYEWRRPGTTGSHQINFRGTNASGTQNYFAVQGYGTSSNARFYVDTYFDKNIGIGTTTPSSLLSISSSTANGSSRLFSIATTSSIFNIQANGNIGIGVENPGSKLEVSDRIRINGITGNYPSLQSYSSSDTSWHGFFINAYRSRGTSTPLPVINSDTVFSFDQFGYDGSSYVKGAQLLSNIDGVVSSGVLPMSWTFNVMNSSGVLSPVMKIKSNGNIGIGTTSPQSSLHIVSSSDVIPLMVASSSGKSMFSVGKDGTVLVGTNYANDPNSYRYGDGFLLATGDIGFIGNGNHNITHASTGNIGIQLFNGLQNITALTASYSGNNGLIGINNSSPLYSLDVKSSGSMNPFNVASSSGSSLFTVLANGNVGIGTNNPLGFAHFSKNQNADTNILITNNATGTSAYTGITIGENPANSQSLQLYYANTGNAAWPSNTALLEAGYNAIGGLVFSTQGNSPVKIFSSNKERLRVTGVGNVGIGTANPTSLLSIASSTATGTFGLFNIATSSSIFSILANGNVGIGTSSPQTPLHIYGDGSHGITLETTGGSMQLSNQGGGLLRLQSGVNGGLSLGSAGDTEIYRYGPSVLKTTGTLLVDDRVSIGTNTLSSMLSIVGTSTRDLFTVSSSTSSTLFNILANGNIGVGVISPTEKLDLGTSGNIRLSSQPGSPGKIIGSENPNKFFALEDGSGSSIWSTYNSLRIRSSQASKDIFTLGIPGSKIESPSATAVGLNVQGSYDQTADLFQWSNSSSTLLGVINSSGYLGVGTSTPQYLVDINGNTRINGELKISSTNNFIAGISADGAGTLLLNSTSVAGANVYGKLAPSGNDGALGDIARRWNGYFTSVNSSATSTFAGNVGIGTTTPSSQLYIAGNGLASSVITADSGPNSTFGLTVRGLTNWSSGVSFNNTTANKSYVTYQDTLGNFKIYDSTVGDRFTVSSLGNIGIGTTTPSFKLDIAASNQQDGIKISDQGGTKNYLTLGSAGRIIHNYEDTNRYYLTSNVGQDLGVTSNDSGGIAMGGGSLVGGSLHGVIAGGGNNGLDRGDLWFYGGKNLVNPSVVFKSEGNVGIGTTTPSSKLTIYSTTTNSDIDIMQILSDVTGTGNTIFRIDSDGDIFTDGGTTIGNPADIAENYSSDEILPPGTLVTFASTTLEWNLKENNQATSTYQMSKIKIAHTGEPVLGIVSTRPGILLGGNTVNGVPVALQGRVPVKVTNENGEILRGDYLTISTSTPGYAMKMTQNGRSLGKVISDVKMEDNQVTGVALVFVENNEHTITISGDAGIESILTLQKNIEDTTVSVASTIISKFKNGLEVITSLVTLKLSAVIAYIDTLHTKELHSENIDTNILCVGTEGNKTCINKEKLDQLLLLGSVQNVSASTDTTTGQTQVSTSSENLQIENTPIIDTLVTEENTTISTSTNETSTSTQTGI